MSTAANSFDARDQLTVGQDTYEIYRLDRIEGSARLPYSLKVLLENLLRNEDGSIVTADQVRAVAEWDPSAEHGKCYDWPCWSVGVSTRRGDAPARL